MTQQITFEEIIHDYGAMIRRIALSYESAPDLAGELCSGNLRRDLASIAFLSRGSCTPTFLARIATNRAVTHVARAMKVPRSVELDVQIPSSIASPEHQAIIGDRSTRLMTAVQQLPAYEEFLFFHP